MKGTLTTIDNFVNLEGKNSDFDQPTLVLDKMLKHANKTLTHTDKP